MAGKPESLQQTNDERAQSATAPCKKTVNDLHVEFRHPSKSIDHAPAKALGIQDTSIVKLCEDCALGKEVMSCK